MENINVNDRYLQPIEVINFFVNETSPKYRSTNVKLVSHFRPLLLNTSSNFGSENHNFLKHITGRLAVVKKLNGEKYLELRPEFRGKDPYTIYCSLNLEEYLNPNETIREIIQIKDDSKIINQKAAKGSAEERGTKSSRIEEDFEKSQVLDEGRENEVGSAKHLGIRVRFTEDTARSRAPISLTLQNELHELVQSEENEIHDNEIDASLTEENVSIAPPLPPHVSASTTSLAPPIPPHSSDSPPPLPPKPTLNKILTKRQTEIKCQRQTSTGFDVRQSSLDNLETGIDKDHRSTQRNETTSILSNIDATQGIEITVDIEQKKFSGSDLEEDDSVFPLPNITAVSGSMRNKRGLTRDNAKTASVKDLTKNFNQIVSKQAEQCNKSNSNIGAVGGRRWRANSNGGVSDVESVARQGGSSASPEDFFAYRPLDERGKRWILAGKRLSGINLNR